MEKKAFFKKRTAREITALPIHETAFSARNLVKKIDDLDLEADYIEVRTPIVPGRFFRTKSGKRLTGAEASRKCLKHGDLVRLTHPKTRQECYSCSDIPLAIRARDFARELEEIKEEDNDFIGYSVQPNWGDRMKRVFPFVWLAEGEKLFNYAENMAFGIGVQAYKNSRRVKKEGAGVVVEVPSRTRKRSRYKYRLSHVPIVRSNENLASVLRLRPSVLREEETGELIEGRTPHENYSIRYGWEDEREGSNVITFYPHDVAGYLGIIEQQKAKHNITPLEMNPFALFSQHGAEFYEKLGNNVVIFDPSLITKDNLRPLHLAEKSILLSRGAGVFGHDDFVYLDAGRDGRIRDYGCWSERR